MIITEDKVVTIQYTLKDNSGKILDTSKKEGLSYIHGKGILVPGLEKELEEKQTGDNFKITLDPKDGYGEYDQSLIFSVSKEKFKDVENLELGMKFRVNTNQGERIIKIKEINGDRITIDMNHPHAGKTLNFDVTVMNVCNNTKEK